MPGPHMIETLGGRGITSCNPDTCEFCKDDRIEQLEKLVEELRADLQKILFNIEKGLDKNEFSDILE